MASQTGTRSKKKAGVRLFSQSLLPIPLSLSCKAATLDWWQRRNMDGDGANPDPGGGPTAARGVGVGKECV